MTRLIINGRNIEAVDGKTVLQAALEAGIYIPHLCYHPQLEPLSEIKASKEIYQRGAVHGGGGNEECEGCRLCLVEIEGREGLIRSCNTVIENGMSVSIDSPEVKEARRANLGRIFERHPHTCLLCQQAEGCDRVCSLHVPEIERCCDKFGNCELQKVAQYIGLEKGLPPYISLQIPILEAEPLLRRNYNLCIGCLRCVKACKELRGAEALGFIIEDGRVVVGSQRPTLKESGCQFCGYCIEVCPTGALTDRDAGVGKREVNLVPCKSRCPAGIDVPRYVRFVAEGKYGEALAVIREKVSFPGVLGHICYHPCESVCRRGKLNEAIAICDLKLFAAGDDSQLWKERSGKAPSTGRSVAVIGSGPAGLTAAYYLAKLGHSVTVFEALAEVGGMMRAGISEKSLPRKVLDHEIEIVSDLGVQIKTNTRVDSLDGLLEQGFEAILIAIGAPHKKYNTVFAQNPGVVEAWGLQGAEGAAVEAGPVACANGKAAFFTAGDVSRGPTLVKKKRAK